MENVPQNKKINWGMIVLLIVLIPVLLLGYKFISKKMDGNENSIQNNTSNKVPEQNNEFPLVGDWYYKDNGAVLKYVNEKYNFTTPQPINGVLKGQVTMTIEWMESVKTLNYEVISNGRLRISEPQNDYPPYEMEYVYNPSSQTLEISDQGHKLTYTRTNNKQVNNSGNSNNSNNNNYSNTSNSNSENLRSAANKIAVIEWKNSKTNNGETFLYTRTFNKPRLENGRIVGEMMRTEKQVGNYCKIETHYTYQMIAANQYSWKIVNQTCGGQPHNIQDVGQTGVSNFELSNGEKSLLVYPIGKSPSEGTTWTH